MQFDFSSVLSFNSIDKKDVINITVYGGNTYITLFKDKKIYFKSSLPESMIYLISYQLYQLMEYIRENKESPHRTYAIRKSFIPETKETREDYKFVFKYDPKPSDYKFVKFEFSVFNPKYQNEFELKLPSYLSITEKLYPINDSLLILKHYYKKFDLDLPLMRILSRDKQVVQNQKNKYKKQY